MPRADVHPTWSHAATIFDEPFKPADFPANPEDLEFAQTFILVANDLMASGKITPHTPDIHDGLENVVEGLKELEAGR
jgi:hypothetical protein